MESSWGELKNYSVAMVQIWGMVVGKGYGEEKEKAEGGWGDLWAQAEKVR